ncbi:MAG TPA: AAA family ATPase [Trebonia sp.]|nr:AAA family ATPase [Trebonia sp.]
MAGVGGDLVRAAEWQQVREFASAARRDTPAALVLTGEAGSGKSSLWRAAVTAAAVSGIRVLRSEPSAADADVPFAGLSDLLGAILPTVAVDLPEPQRQALALILPGGFATGPAPAPHAVGRALLAALASLLRAGPLMLAVDDVHCLDVDSLHSLAFAARRVGSRPLSLLIAARTSAPADPLTVGDRPPAQDWRSLLAAFGTAAEIVLRPLDATQVRCLLPTTATSAQARLVASQSRGNPFWAREIWANLASGTALSPADDVPVPAIARAALAERLAHHLDLPAAEALAVVAAAGRITASHAAIVLADLDVPVDGIDAAVLAGVVVAADGKLAAAHPLIGTAAVEALPADRRALIYRRLAAISAGPERSAQFAALAATASGAGQAPDVADLLDTAAEAAHAKAANTAAGKFAAQAVTFTPAADTKALTRRRIRAGELLFLASDLAGARAQLEVLDLDSLPTADLERVLPPLVDAVEYLGEQAAATAMITRALETAGDDNRRRALVLSLASDFSYGIQGRRRESAIEAIRCAEAAGPTANRSLHRALVNLAGEKTIAGEGLDVQLLDRASRIERWLPDVPLYATAGFHRGAWSRFTENLEVVRTALRTSIEQAREAGEDLTLALFLSYLALTEELAGDYAKATAILAEVRMLEAAYDWPPSPWLLEPQCKLLIAAGNPGEAVRLADTYLPEDDGQQFTMKFTGACLRGNAKWWAGDLPAAIRHLELAARYADESGWQDPGVRSRIDPLLAEAYLATGRPAEAARIAAWLHETGTRMNRPTLVGDAHRIDALAAAANGDLEAAAASARAAVAAHEQSPLRPELARSLLVLGRIERQRRDRPAFRAALGRSRDLALAIGHQPLLASIKKESPRAVPPPAREGNTLTEAERRVADQISRGATSREAAAELFLSVRTVDGHVASICRKLGVRSRSELRRVLT